MGKVNGVVSALVRCPLVEGGFRMRDRLLELVLRFPRIFPLQLLRDGLELRGRLSA